MRDHLTGRRVQKTEGDYQHTGTVVADFLTLRGRRRIVVEFDPPVSGLLHIFRPEQVEEIPFIPYG